MAKRFFSARTATIIALTSVCWGLFGWGLVQLVLSPYATPATGAPLDSSGNGPPTVHALDPLTIEGALLDTRMIPSEQSTVRAPAAGLSTTAATNLYALAGVLVPTDPNQLPVAVLSVAGGTALTLSIGDSVPGLGEIVDITNTQVTVNLFDTSGLAYLKLNR